MQTFNTSPHCEVILNNDRESVFRKHIWMKDSGIAVVLCAKAKTKADSVYCGLAN